MTVTDPTTSGILSNIAAPQQTDYLATMAAPQYRAGLGGIQYFTPMQYQPAGQESTVTDLPIEMPILLDQNSPMPNTSTTTPPMAGIPQELATYTPDQKINYYNRNQVSADQLLAGGASQGDIDWMRQNGYMDLPSNWATYTPDQKISLLNDRGINANQLLQSGVAQSDIDWMRQQGYDGRSVQGRLQDVNSTASYNQWLEDARAAGIDTSGVEQRYNALEDEWSDKPWGTTDNVLATNNLYSQIKGTHNAITQSRGGRDYWSGEGYGSLDNNMRAFAQRLGNKVADLNQIGVREEPKLVPTEFFKRQDAEGNLLWYRVEPSGYDSGDLVPATPAEAQQLSELPPAQEGSAVSINRDTGEKTRRLINKETGEVIDDSNGEWRGQDNVFRVGYTTKGDGMVHYVIKMQERVDPQTGEKSYTPVPIATYEDTGASDMEALGAVLGMASFIPGVAPFAQMANAGLQASQGNWLGALASGIGAVPGVGNALGGVGTIGADTARTLNNVSTGLRTAGSLASGDYLGAITGAGNLLGAGNLTVPGTEGVFGGNGLQLGELTRGIGALGALGKGDYLGAALGAAGVAGVTNVPGTDMNLRNIQNALRLSRALESGNLTGIINSAGNWGRQAGVIPRMAHGGLASLPV